MGGVLTGSDDSSALVKKGLGTLALTNDNAFNGGITLNAGILQLSGLAGAVPQPLAGGSITVNAGLLSLLNNGVASNSQILYSAPIVGGLGAAAVNLQIGNAGSNTGSTIELASVSLVGGQSLNIAGLSRCGSIRRLGQR